LLELAGTIPDLPSDLATEHDHYIYGAPRRSKGVPMSLWGTVQEGVVVFDAPADLPNGTKVEVLVRETPAAASPLGEKLLRHAGKAQGLPEDAAAQHDHYLYGTPKR
jgi:hypothetical protein